jgi:E3 ubiquitin-protein ligase Topors
LTTLVDSCSLEQFLTNLIISLMKAIDIRSESAVKLLAEFLDMDVQYEPGQRHVNAEHFAHGWPIFH